MHLSLAKTIALAMAAFFFVIAPSWSQRSPDGSRPPPPSATPPSATEDEQRSIYTFQVENDVFNRFGRSDRDYTSGVRAGWLSPAITEMPRGIVAMTTIPTFLGEAPADSVIRRVAVSIGQNIVSLRRRPPVLNEMC